MSDHLPECQRWWTDMPEPDECPACGMFRACEERVREDERALICVEQTALAELNAEYRKGLDAAREAVERVSSLLQPLGPALAAIDTLRGES